MNNENPLHNQTLIRRCIKLLFLTCISVEILTGSIHVQAEPWVDTRDLWLRQDIELLVDAGIINSPITTYPLMWSNIAEDLDNTKIEDVPDNYKPIFWRLKKRMSAAFRSNGVRQLRFSAASSSPIIRSFGDISREEAELSARNSGMSDSWAWNAEITYVADAYDDKDIRPDGSYLAAIWGNWVLSAGWIERWWGPTWSSANLISNNARPTPGFALQRNYAAPFESDWLSWIGPWSLDTFFGQLDDERYVDDAFLIGASVTFKPLSSLEIGLRRTAQWGGEGRPDDLSSLFNLIIGHDNCGSDGISCENKDNEPGNQIAGVDFRWTLPFDTPSNVYLSTVGEDEADYFPAKRIYSLGFSSVFNGWGNNYRWYVEYTDTAVWKERYNIAYEHHIYRTGYRYHGRAIGATYDNDSTALVVGVMGDVTSNDQLAVRFKQLELNKDGDPWLDGVRNSISDSPLMTNNLNISWQHQLLQNGKMKVNLDYFSQELNSFGRENGQFLLSVDWEYPLK